MAATVSPSVLPLRSAIPYSVTTRSRSARGSAAFARGVPAERVGVGDRRHAQFAQLLGGHCSETVVKRLVANEEAGVDEDLFALRTRHAAAENAGVLESEERVDQHFGAAVEA